MSPPKGFLASVLIADDDALVRQVLRMVLTRAGYAVVEAADAAGVVRAASRLLPDLVILDVNMPAGTFHETLGALRAEQPELPILVLSGELTRPRDLTGVPFDFARKPIGHDELLARVENLLCDTSISPR